MRRAFVFAIVAVLVVSAVVSALPDVVVLNKTPYSYNGNAGGWWWSPGGSNSKSWGDSVYAEIAFVCYAPRPVAINVFGVYAGGNAWSGTVKANITSGWYLFYFARYHTDKTYGVAKVYRIFDNNITSVYSKSGVNTYQDYNPSQYYYNANHSIVCDSVYFFSPLESGEAPKYNVIYKAFDWITGKNSKVIVIKSKADPVSIILYNSSGGKIYEQGFAVNDTTLIILNDSKITLHAQGPGGTKELTITEDGVYTVRLTPELTEIVFSSNANYTVMVVVKDNSTGDDLVADYIRVYNYTGGTLVAEARNTATATFTLPPGTYNFVAKKGSAYASLIREISGNETIYIFLSASGTGGGGGSWLYVDAVCPGGHSVTAQATLSNSTWSSVKATPANFTVSPGTYSLKIEVQGYETFQTNVDVNGPTFYTATLIPQNGGSGNSSGWGLPWHWNVTWPWEGWNITNPFGDLWRQISDPVGYWLDQHGLGWLKDWWWAVLLAIVVILIVIAKED